MTKLHCDVCDKVIVQDALVVYLGKYGNGPYANELCVTCALEKMPEGLKLYREKDKQFSESLNQLTAPATPTNGR